MDIQICNTVPKLFWHHVENHADEISIWQKQQGTWESITWGEYGDFVKDIANALLDAGIQRADKVSINTAAINNPDFIRSLDMSSVSNDPLVLK